MSSEASRQKYNGAFCLKSEQRGLSHSAILHLFAKLSSTNMKHPALISYRLKLLLHFVQNITVEISATLHFDKQSGTFSGELLTPH